MIEIENGHPICLNYKKSEVKALIVKAAESKGVIKYKNMYDIFLEEKEQEISFLTWRHSVWYTFERVCGELATLDGAIYYALMSNKRNLPEDQFWETFYRYRCEEYARKFNKTLPDISNLTLELKNELVSYERDVSVK